MSLLRNDTLLILVQARSFFCKTNKNPQLLVDGFETCLFLYREFETEILRMLIPATTEGIFNSTKRILYCSFYAWVKGVFR